MDHPVMDCLVSNNLFIFYDDKLYKFWSIKKAGLLYVLEKYQNKSDMYDKILEYYVWKFSTPPKLIV